MKAKKLAELFDVEIGSNLEDDVDTVTVSFDQRIDDIQAVLQPEPTNPANEIQTKPKPADETDAETIRKAIKGQKTLPEPEIDTVIDDDSEHSEEDELEIPGDVASVVSPENATASGSGADNPLGLEGLDLVAYQEIKQKFPQFTIYDGNVAYRDFYRWKCYHLRHLLSRFPLLDLSDMSEELHQTEINHFVGDDIISPDLIQRKLDDTYRCRTRVASLLITAFEQYYAWDRTLEMLKAKLWKDHDIKGAHKRDGLVLEHASDIEFYVSRMKGFIDSAKHYDLMLRAAADSLSRQLTCVQLREHVVGNRFDERHGGGHDVDELSRFDSLEVGSVITAPRVDQKNAVMDVHYGQKDDVSEIG